MTVVLLDGRSGHDGSATRGIGTYLRGLLSGLAQVANEWDFEVLLEAAAELPQEWRSWGVRPHPYRVPHVPRHLRPFLDPLCVRRAISRRRPDLYHGVEFGQPVAPQVPVVVTVHDLIPFVLPELYPWMRRERRLSLMQLRHADAIIAVSQSTARDLIRIAGADRRRITVVAEGVTVPPPPSEAELDQIRERLRLPDRFVLAVGTFDPRKDITKLADVVRRLRTEADVALVIAGYQGNYTAAVARSIDRAGLTLVTRMLGYVSSDELDGLYRMASCLVFTSAYEGFGLPPLEALARGTPVVAFNNSSLPEVVGDIGRLVLDGDTISMAEAVAATICDPAAIRDIARLGPEHAAQFTWASAAAATLRVYRRATEGT